MVCNWLDGERSLPLSYWGFLCFSETLADPLSTTSSSPFQVTWECVILKHGVKNVAFLKLNQTSLFGKHTLLLCFVLKSSIFFYCPTKSTLNNKNTKKIYNTVGNLNVNDRTAWTVITELCKHINLHRKCKTRSGSGLVARHPLWSFHCGTYSATQPSSMPVTSAHVY